MRPPAAAAALLLPLLAAGACPRVHDSRVGAPAAEEPAAEAEPPLAAHPLTPEVSAAVPAAPAGQPTGEVDFAAQVQPILAARCQPCHFPGGKMYDELPFDDPATVRHLGERLFTRIRAAEEQAVIRAFLAQEASGGGDAAERRQ